jgi:anti-sigma regulatory factor (Ser/Thr protein kinase)
VTGAALLQMRFTMADLPRLRLRVGEAASFAGLDESRCEDFVLAAYELAGNAILHGGGVGFLRLRRDDTFLHCEVSDDGPGFPGRPDFSGRGLRLARELTDAIEIGGGAGAVVTLTVMCRSDRQLVD